MNKRSRFGGSGNRALGRRIWLPILFVAVTGAGAVQAERASLVIDASDGRVLHAKNANLSSYPASLTKMMTVYLALKAIRAGRLSKDDRLQVSATAQTQPPVELGLTRGSTLSLQDALLATIVRSANDAAVVLAEGITGTETAFVGQMNAEAERLGMTRTRFQNASGLPAARQTTTARDVATLARALIDDFPESYPLFATRSFRYGQRQFHSHNNILSRVEGADGLKTGFACKAGYNLAASAKRGDRRLIGVVLGEQAPDQRDALMARLLEAGFTAAEKPPAAELDLESLAGADDQGAGEPVNGETLADSCRVHQGSGWSVEVAGMVEKNQALGTARRAIREQGGTLKGGRPLLIPRPGGRKRVYRAVITGLARESAIATCLNMRKSKAHCIVLPPENLRIALTTARKLGLMGGGR